MKKFILGLCIVTTMLSCSKEEVTQKEEFKSSTVNTEARVEGEIYLEDLNDLEKVPDSIYAGVIEAVISGSCETCRCVRTGEMPVHGVQNLIVYHVICSTGTHCLVVWNVSTQQVVDAWVESKYSNFHWFDRQFSSKGENISDEDYIANMMLELNNGTLSEDDASKINCRTIIHHNGYGSGHGPYTTIHACVERNKITYEVNWTSGYAYPDGTEMVPAWNVQVNSQCHC